MGILVLRSEAVISVITVGQTGLCEATGKGTLSSAAVPLQEEEGGSHRAADSDQRIPGQKGMETQEERRHPFTGSHQGRSGQESPREEEERCKYTSSEKIKDMFV